MFLVLLAQLSKAGCIVRIILPHGQGPNQQTMIDPKQTPKSPKNDSNAGAKTVTEKRATKSGETVAWRLRVAPSEIAISTPVSLQIDHSISPLSAPKSPQKPPPKPRPKREPKVDRKCGLKRAYRLRSPGLYRSRGSRQGCAVQMRVKIETISVQNTPKIMDLY